MWAIVTYERNLSNDTTVKSPVAGTSESPTFAGVADLGDTASTDTATASGTE